ncbi:MAG: hemerythrin domain-containing protein [Novosphingobium sp.]
MVRIGSTPATEFRGDPEIFGRLIEDHDRHRRLLAQIAETVGASEERRALFAELTYELKGHAAAEEQAVWSSVLRKPETTDLGRHAVAEHKDIDDLLNELAARDMAQGSWLVRFHALRDEYLHHIREEEQEIFEGVARVLDQADRDHMKAVFERRKAAEKAAAEITPKLVPAD